MKTSTMKYGPEFWKTAKGEIITDPKTAEKKEAKGEELYLYVWNNTLKKYLGIPS